MRRRTMHSLFGAVSACALVVSLWHGWQQIQYRETVAAVDRVPSVLTESPLAPVGDANPAIALATANALAAGENFEAAEAMFVALVDRYSEQLPGQVARFNLANLYLREGTREDLPGGTTRALLEIAKQRYRDLLQHNPTDWDARYNLELALRVAPERDTDNSNKGPPPKSVRVIVPDFEADNLP